MGRLFHSPSRWAAVMDAGTELIVMLTMFMTLLGGITGPVFFCLAITCVGAARYILLVCAILEAGLFAIGVVMWVQL